MKNRSAIEAALAQADIAGYAPAPRQDARTDARREGGSSAPGKTLGRISARAEHSPWKRAMDIVVAGAALLFLSPLMLLVAILIKAEDGGPILFVHNRCGARGRMFGCMKFRSMRVDAAERLEWLLANDKDALEDWRRYQKLKNDPRITPIGKFIRKTSLDELPQLINILLGQMSVIGPRPITSGEIYRYGDAYAYYSSVRPGISGLWQVSGRNNLTYPERVELDVRYVRTWSIWRDIEILFKTVPVVLLGSGAG